MASPAGGGLMERDEYGRLVRAETTLEILGERLDEVRDDMRERLQEVREELQDHRDESTRKHDELRDMLTKLGAKIDERAFRWSALLNKDTVKLVLYAIASLAGGAGVAKAIFGE